jgi:hypothetical protein
MDESLTYQDQLDPYFLITSTSGVFKKEVNKFLKIEDIEVWETKAKQKLREAKVLLKDCTKSRLDVKNKLENYTEVSAIQLLCKERSSILQELSVHKNTTDSLIRLKSYLVKRSKYKKVYTRYIKLRSSIEKVESLRDKENILLKKLRDYTTCKNYIIKKSKFTRLIDETKINYISGMKKLGVCPFCFSEVSSKRIKNNL